MLKYLAGLTTFLIFGLVLQPVSSLANCPFCAGVPMTFAEEIASQDVVAFGKLVEAFEEDHEALFRVHTILKGKKLTKVGQDVRISFFGKTDADKNYYLRAVDPPDLLWSSPMPVGDGLMAYLKQSVTLPEDPQKRQRFYLSQLENADEQIAEDAYGELAKVPYAEIKALKPYMDRSQVLEWIKDTGVPPSRRRLYFVMLGVCGKPKDADLLEKMLRSENEDLRAGLDAMIGCYAMLKGEPGLELIDELFLENKKSQYADTYAAIMALRVHGTEFGVLEKERILQSMRLILDRPELADLVIPDLARWEDWSQMDKLVELFKTSDDKSSWVRVPVINYLRACPLPEAEEKLEIVKELDPAAFKRAKTYFPFPRASDSDSSAITRENGVSKLVISDSPPRVKDRQQLASAQANRGHFRPATDSKIEARVAGAPIVAYSGPQSTNLVVAVCVVSMAATTLWLAMWLSLSGAGARGMFSALVVQQFAGLKRSVGRANGVE